MSHHHRHHHHARPQSHAHRHRVHPNPASQAAGAARGAEVAGAGVMGERFLGQQQTREFAEAAFEKMPKNMVSGLAVGFLLGGAAGAYAMHEHQSHAARLADERERLNVRSR